MLAARRFRARGARRPRRLRVRRRPGLGADRRRGSRRRPGDRLPAYARDVRDRRHRADDARRRAGARDDRERVHVRLAAARRSCSSPSTAAPDVRDAARGQPVRRQRARPGPDRALGPLRRRGRPRGSSPEFAVVRETPLVEGALAHFVARVVRSYWGGDHSLFLGHVEYARYGKGEPLLFHGGRYERMVGDPELFSRLPTRAARPAALPGPRGALRARRRADGAR